MLNVVLMLSRHSKNFTKMRDDATYSQVPRPSCDCDSDDATCHVLAVASTTLPHTLCNSIVSAVERKSIAACGSVVCLRGSGVLAANQAANQPTRRAASF